MKKIILSLALFGVVSSPLAIFAAGPVFVIPAAASTTSQTQPRVISQEKLLVKKLGQIKKKSKDTKQKIKTNIGQSKTQVAKVKKARAKVKKTRASNTTKATTTVR